MNKFKWMGLIGFLLQFVSVPALLMLPVAPWLSAILALMVIAGLVMMVAGIVLGNIYAPEDRTEPKPENPDYYE